MSDEASGPALPGEQCRVPPRESWSDLEKWVWHEIGSGRIADINAHLGKTADPRKPDDWGPERRLSTAFLEVMLLHDPWRSTIPRRGVRIVGAWFDETVDLVEAEIAHELRLSRSRFTSEFYLVRLQMQSLLSLYGSVITGTLNMDSAIVGGGMHMGNGAQFADVRLRGARIENQLNLVGAKVTGRLNMNSASIAGALLMREGAECERAEFGEVDLRGARIQGPLELVGAKVTGGLNINSSSIGGPLLMSKGAEFTEVDLRGARIEGSLNLVGAKVTGPLAMDGVRIAAALLMEGAEFTQVILRGARINGHLSLIGAKVTRTLDMNAVNIHGALLMRERAEFAEVDLRGARIEGQLSLIDAKVPGRLDTDSVSIGGSLLMREGQFLQPINLVFGTVGGSLDLRGATLAGLYLAGARIESLHLASGSRRPTWATGARLVLGNARVGAVQDEPDAWPQDLELDGFTYARFGGLGSDAGRGIGSRSSEWFQKWLERHAPYTPQPYQHCARVLREMGHPEMANDVAYAGRERERGEFWRRSKWRWFGLWLLKWTIGYGYGLRYFRSLWWALFFVVVGTLVLLGCGAPRAIAVPITWATAGGMKIFSYLAALAFYSFDLLLPIIQLYEPHYQVLLDGVAKYYFAFHKLMGYVLASFLIAGLAGLTK
jgi:uncharacterized protein YjbI with pentapeptide repeats